MTEQREPTAMEKTVCIVALGALVVGALLFPSSRTVLGSILEGVVVVFRPVIALIPAVLLASLWGLAEFIIRPAKAWQFFSAIAATAAIWLLPPLGNTFFMERYHPSETYEPSFVFGFWSVLVFGILLFRAGQLSVSGRHAEPPPN